MGACFYFFLQWYHFDYAATTIQAVLTMDQKGMLY